MRRSTSKSEKDYEVNERFLIIIFYVSDIFIIFFINCSIIILIIIIITSAIKAIANTRLAFSVCDPPPPSSPAPP